ncbi:Uncharacterised protein [Vibrio cholerae]|nr:Uncharacterised protein [Vibrio cholerae]
MSWSSNHKVNRHSSSIVYSRRILRLFCSPIPITLIGFACLNN